MLNCTDFNDRLWDEDCRCALAGRGPVPADVAVHRDACSACHQAWTEAADDLATLPHLLLVPAPAALQARLQRGMAERLPPSPALDWTAGIVWATIGAVVALAVAGEFPAWIAGLGPLCLSLVGASLAFSASAARNALREALG
ncbi:MAG TPA: hypothetical protein VHR45_13885 [Thermoanaerobaculia bacterium]|nr:hypothetical protein [Thermoanaerobaculia bacterium]